MNFFHNIISRRLFRKPNGGILRLAVSACEKLKGWTEDRTSDYCSK